MTQGITEVWRYERLNTFGGGCRSGSGEYSDQNYAQTQHNRRTRIRQLVTMNFDSTSKFVTLTFNDHQQFSISDVKACNAYFKRFVMRMKYRYKDFKYVAVIEFQDKNARGAVHYHMICNLPFIKKAELAQIWGGGFVKINRIDKVDNVGAYVVKYMCKDTEDTRLCGENAYLHSRGLSEPIEVCSWRSGSDKETADQIMGLLKEKSPSYAATYESEKAGHIEYYQYNANRK